MAAAGDYNLIGNHPTVNFTATEIHFPIVSEQHALKARALIHGYLGTVASDIEKNVGSKQTTGEHNFGIVDRKIPAHVDDERGHRGALQSERAAS